MFVPVVDRNQKPLMPTKPSRARKWIKEGKATPFFKKGVFCVRLNVEPSNGKKQEIAVGVDPGSKKEGLTVKSKSHTYLNIQADAVTWVKRHVKTRRDMRRGRRYRNAPYRKPRFYRKGRTLPPSTKARWQWKLRLCSWLCKMFPVSIFIVEDIKAKPKKGQRRWNVSFSPLQHGKTWFYEELGKLAFVETKRGYETYELRENFGLKKIASKEAAFDAHCVDSWVLANSKVGGHARPENKAVLLIIPLQFHRRQLHYLQPKKGNIRSPYGGTRSLGFKRGSLVKHSKWGLCYIGGVPQPNRISLHSLKTRKRLTQLAKPEDCKFLTYASWRAQSALL